MCWCLALLSVVGPIPAGTAPWLGWLLVGLGAVVLAVCAGVLLGRRSGVRTQSSVAETATAEQFEQLRKQVRELRAMTKDAADDLDRKADRLERLVARAEALSDTFDRMTTPPAHERTATRSGARSDPLTADDASNAVMAFTRRGMSVVEISRATGLLPGQVELVQALHGKAQGR